MGVLDDILNCEECEEAGNKLISRECHGCGTIVPANFEEARKELATLRASQLSPAIVDAVKAYQAVCLDVCDDNSPRWHEGYELRRAIDRAIEADAKEREG